MRWFKNLKVRTKLFIVFGIIFLLNFFVSGLALLQQSQFKDFIHNIVEDRYVKVNKMNEIKVDVLTIAELLRDMLLVEDKKQIDSIMAKVRELQASVAEKIKYFDVAIRSEEGKKLLSELKSARDVYIQERERQYKLLQEGKIKEARELLMGDVKRAQNKYFEVIEKNINFQERRMAETVKDTDFKYKQSLIFLGGSGLVSVFLILFFALIITKSIATPLKKCTSVLESLAEGDLTKGMELEKENVSKDEIGTLISSVSHMSKKLRSIVFELKSTSDTLASASQQLSASSEELSRGVAEQSSKASQIATSSTETSQTIIDIAKNASNIASASVDTTKTAKEGEEIVSKAVHEVKAIENTVVESAKLITSLGERSQQIGDIVNVIKDIADQTNLLALNAAIEAARAGEQGRGFAVVADEVRKLAERTSKATSEIGSMINAIQDEVKKTVTSMDKATRSVEIGVDHSAKAGEALRKIVEKVDSLQSMVQQIASATEEMSTVSEQISADIETVANVSREISSAGEQIAKSSSDLARLASKLSELVGQFKI